MDDHIQLIERARARAQHARAVRQQKAQQQRAVQSEKAKKRAKTVKAASLLAIAASPLNSLEGHASQVDLPENVLELVMSHIAHALEPGGVVGPSIVARNLANAALVCSEFYLASRHGFSTLNRLVQTSLNQHLHKQPLPPEPSTYLSAMTRQQHAEALVLARGQDLPGTGWDWDFWDSVITCPMTIPLSQIWKAARHLGVPLPLAQNYIQQQEQLHRQQVPAQPPAAAPAPAVAAPAAEPSDVSQAAEQQQQQQEEYVPQLSKKQHQRLVANILAAFGLETPRPATQPTPPPAAAAAAGSSKDTPSSSQGTAAAGAQHSCSCAYAAVLRAVVLERCSPAVAWDGPDQCKTLRTAVSELSQLRSKVVLKAQHYNGTRVCLATIRQELIAAGATSLQQLQAVLAREKAAAEQARLQQQQRQQQREEQEQEKRRQQQQQKAKASPAKSGKGFSLGSIVIKPREKRHDIIT